MIGVFRRQGIEFYALPAHTSGKNQHLDVVLFSVFNNYLNDAMSNCSGFNDDIKLVIFDLCGIMKQVYERAFTRANITFRFKQTGLWPVDFYSLLGVNRPSDGTSNAKCLTVDHLKDAYGSK